MPFRMTVLVNESTLRRQIAVCPNGLTSIPDIDVRY